MQTGIPATPLIEQLRSPRTAVYDKFNVRQAGLDEIVNGVVPFVKDIYATRGYQINPQKAMLELAGGTTLIVTNRRGIAGTMTLRYETPARSLLADEIFAPELAALRVRRLALCEVTKLAVRPDADSTMVLGAMFRSAFRLGAARGSEVAIAEVNPRHKRFYERLGFRSMGDIRQNLRVNAPACLLTLDLTSTAHQMEDVWDVVRDGERRRNMFTRKM